jgi:hypothetical protein
LGSFVRQKLINDELLKATNKASIIMKDQTFDELHLFSGICKNLGRIFGLTAENVRGKNQGKI